MLTLKKSKNTFYKLMPYILLSIFTLPTILGFIWIVICTFSTRTHGLIPVDINGNIGGITLKNWIFLKDKAIWFVTFNTFLLAIGLTIGVIVVSAMAGYGLSRLNFKGRKGFLSLTLMLHAFPSVTLLIAIYFVLRWISAIPVLGKGIPLIGGFGYNTIGGVILVSIALQLPLGIWLTKGFFDNISWDIERASLIDGCSRFRCFYQIMLPQIRPGLFALSIFSFIQGWGSFLIPYSFMTNQTKSTIATYLNSLLSLTAPVNYSMVAAVGLFQLLPIMIFFLFTQKYLLNIYSGGTKGGV